MIPERCICGHRRASHAAMVVTLRPCERDGCGCPGFVPTSDLLGHDVGCTEWRGEPCSCHLPVDERPGFSEEGSDWFGCNRKGCGRPQSEHEFGVFCP